MRLILILMIIIISISILGCLSDGTEEARSGIATREANYSCREQHNCD